MATTRLGLNGFGARPAGSFAGKAIETHPVVKITRLGINGFGVRTTGDFSGKTIISDGPHPVANITRLGLNGFGVKRAGSFADRLPFEPVIPTPEIPPIPGTGGGRGTGPIRPYGTGYDRYREEDLKESRKRKILQEDDEMIALIMSVVTKGLL